MFLLNHDNLWTLYKSIFLYILQKLSHTSISVIVQLFLLLIFLTSIFVFCIILLAIVLEILIFPFIIYTCTFVLPNTILMSFHSLQCSYCCFLWILTPFVMVVTALCIDSPSAVFIRNRHLRLLMHRAVTATRNNNINTVQTTSYFIIILLLH